MSGTVFCCTIPVEWGRGDASRHKPRRIERVVPVAGASFTTSPTPNLAPPKNPPPAETGPTFGGYLFPGLTRLVSIVSPRVIRCSSASNWRHCQPAARCSSAAPARACSLLLCSYPSIPLHRRSHSPPPSSIDFKLGVRPALLTNSVHQVRRRAPDLQQLQKVKAGLPWLRSHFPSSARASGQRQPFPTDPLDSAAILVCPHFLRILSRPSHADIILGDGSYRRASAQPPRH